jgi:transposase
VHTTFISPALPGRRRRRHSDDFKSEVVAACRRPGVSIAAVALANGLNANLVRRWMVEAGCAASTKPVACNEASEQAPAVHASQLPSFVPVKLEPDARGPDIRIEINRHGTLVSVSWPASAAGECGAWLREMLR